MIQGSAGFSISKIKRQLQFDSAARQQQSTEKHLLITPQSLQMLLNSSHGPERENGDDQIYLSSGKKTPVGQRKEIQREDMIENSSVLGSESIYNISPFSSCKKEVLPKEKEINTPKNIGLFDYGANLKMNSLAQLNHLKMFITQKQYNESILQFQIPIKRVKRDEQEEGKENKNPQIQVKSSKGFNTEEKKIIYNSEYLQRLGLPVPETVIKQKLLEKEREMNNLATNSLLTKNDNVSQNIKDNNILKANQSVILTKDVSFKFPQQLERKEKVILGIQGTQQREKHQKKDLQDTFKNESIPEKNIFKCVQPINQQNINQQSEIGSRDQSQLIKLSQEGDKNGRSQFENVENEEKVARQLEQKMKILYTETQFQLLERKANQNGFHQPCELGKIKINKINEKIEYKQEKLMERFRKETEGEKIISGTQVRRQLNDNDKLISQKQETQNEILRKEYLQRENLFVEPQIRRILNENEKNIIFITWVKKNLQDLNYWIQKSKSCINMDFLEEKGYFKCIVSLSTSQKKNVIQVSSQSSSKKEARKNVMRKLAQKVIANDQLFWEGVTGRQYVENIIREYKDSDEGDDILRSILVEEEDNKQEKDKQSHQYKINQIRKSEEKEKANKDKFKVSKLVRQMQSCVREDKVIEALEKLSSIAALKIEISYKEASFLWNYAVQKGNLILLKIILDVIHYRKFSSQMLQALPHQQTDPQQAVSELLGQFQQTPSSKGLKNVNIILNQSLNVTRTLLSINPFEQTNNELYSLLPPTPSQGQPAQVQINSDSFSIRNSLSLVESLSFLAVKKTIKKSVNMKSEEQCQEEQNQWPAQFYQKEQKSTFDKTGIRLSQALLRKDPYLHYLEWEDLNQLFYSLILADNPVFALQVCELIYTYAKISPDSLLGSSFFYFFNKKLILFEEFIEGTIQPSLQPGNLLPKKEGNTLLQGSLEYIGSNFEQDQFIFRVIGETGEIFTSASRQLQEGDLCQLSILQNSEQEVASCFIKECFFNENLPYFKISMVLLSDQQKRANFIKADGLKYYSLCKVSSTKKLFSESKALDSICSKVSMLHSIFLKLTLGDGYSNYQDPVRVVQEINLQSIAAAHNLNEELVDALQSASTNDLTLIQGTHNSRRSELAICIVREWLQQSNLKILVKCDSEAKAKHFLCQLHSSTVKQHQSLTTVSQVIPFCPSACLLLDDSSAETFSSACKTIQNMSSNMSSKIKRRLEESQIIIVSNVENMAPLKDCQFNRVILLNAEQIPEQTTWQFLVRNCNQLTLIGDLTAFKRQSTQSILSKSRCGDSSLFERLISSGIDPIVLKTRYIPHSSSDMKSMSNNDPNKILNSLLIGGLHSKLFFSEPLKLSSSNATNAVNVNVNDNSININQNTGEEVLIVALKGNEELVEQREEGFQNQLEAQCIIGIVNSLMKEQNVDINNIRIAVSTKAQEKMLINLSSQSQNISQIVKTIDKPFNQSYDFVIFSGIRSNAKGDIGETKNPAILSTLLQYTLHKFIFVGDIDLYSQDPTWRQFILTCFSKKQIFFVNPPNSAAREEGED